jgi:DNA polymerase-1
VSHNGLGFDDHKTGLVTDYDTMWLAYLCDENQPLGLESLACKYLGSHGWKESRDGAPLGSRELAEYNARDAKITLQLYEKLVEELGPRINLYNHILRPAYDVFQRATERGVYIDQDAVQHFHDDLVAQKGGAQHELENWGISGPFQNAKIAEVLEADGIWLPSTETGKLCVDKQTLQKIQHPVAELVLAARSLQKMESTYVRPYTAVSGPGKDGRVHSEYTLIRTVVGRTSARRPNIQNLPRTCKDFLSAPLGSTFVTADYNALHFRLAAWCANEDEILQRYNEDPYWDPHRWFGGILYSKPEADVTKAERQIAKSANFSQLYLGNAVTLQDYMDRMGIYLPLDECQRIHVLWHEIFPNFRKWYAQVENEMRQFGYVETATGRRRHFGDVKGVWGTAYEDMKKEAVNFKVLGLEPDVALTGMIIAENQGVPVNYFCHDSIGFECEEGESTRLANVLEESMTTRAVEALRKNFGVNLDVPLVVETTFNQGYH